MNRNQFNTNAVEQKEGKKNDSNVAYKKEEQKEDSDSGEDFDYDQEEEEGGTDSGKKEEDIDLMQFISNMDVSNIKKDVSSGSD